MKPRFPNTHISAVLFGLTLVVAINSRGGAVEILMLVCATVGLICEARIIWTTRK